MDELMGNISIEHTHQPVSGVMQLWVRHVIKICV